MVAITQQMRKQIEIMVQTEQRNYRNKQREEHSRIKNDRPVSAISEERAFDTAFERWGKHL